MISAIAKYQEEKSKKPRGVGEYALNRGIETIGGVKFRPEHSGYELTHICEMKALSEWPAICAAVSMVYEYEHLHRACVQNLMDGSMLYAATLLTVAELLKSQRRLTTEDIHELEQLLQLIDDYWRMTAETDQMAV
jgi:hypothetical protein